MNVLTGMSNMAEFLKVYCYLRGDQAANGPMECSEISIQATPDALRELAALMTKFADDMQLSKDEDMMHVHLQDVWKGWVADYPDVIVVSPPAS